MNRGQRMRAQVILALVSIIGVAGLLIAIYMFTYSRIDYTAIDHIESLQKGPNSFADLSGDIGVTSVDDLGFTVEEDYHLIIYYGKQVIKVPPAAFESTEFRDALKRIGIEIFHHVNDDGSILYKVTYWGEPIDKFSLVS